MAIQRLITAIKNKGSILCVGLDPSVEQLPQVHRNQIEQKGITLENAAEEVLKFNMAIIDAIHDLVPVVKPQAAYYEQLGVPGMQAYQKTIEYAKLRGLFVIGDVKRGDIGSTSIAYANAHLGTVTLLGKSIKVFDADAATINPYLGDDSNKPFYQVADQSDKMNFLLVKTSNPSSGQLQNKLIEERPVYQWVADMLNDAMNGKPNYEGYGNIGAVVGATYPEELAALRKLMPNAYFLIPGYGAQGGTAADIVAGFDNRGLGAIVNSSRGIIYAFDQQVKDSSYTLAIRNAVLSANRDLNQALATAGKSL